MVQKVWIPLPVQIELVLWIVVPRLIEQVGWLGLAERVEQKWMEQPE